MLTRLLTIFAVLVLAACGDVWNDPYPASDDGRALLYESFMQRPKHLDPVQSYVEDESWFVQSTYETLLEYHYLKRPYTLVPALARDMPTITYRDASGAELPHDAPVERIAQTEYVFRLRDDVVYQPHPAFAVDEHGQPRYAALDDASLGTRSQIGDFEHTGTRPLVAADFVYQFKRLARPGIESPAFPIFQRIPGMLELAQQLRAEVDARRLDPAGWIDLRNYPLPGVDAPDAHTLRVRIRGKYPQFIYWLAMSFVVPMPWEAERFYAQPGMARRELTLDMWPVGTGPFMLTRNRPLREMRLERNPNFRVQTYPCEGAPGDAEAGLLRDCGKRLPLIDGVVFAYEKESTPFWNKFMQGYYDFYSSARFAGLSSFDSALQLQGNALSLSSAMAERGLRLATEVEPAIVYSFVNMLDPVIGDAGATPGERERARKVRRAMAIAINTEETLAILQNGLGVPMQVFVPPGVPGYTSGEKGINPYVYTWANGRPQRRDLGEARRLLAEAGYKDGRDAITGKPLIVYFDSVDSRGRAGLDLLIKQLAQIDIQLVPRLTEWNRFQEKHRKGFAQFSSWGWNADYPDPENFMFLLYSGNGKVKYQGENVTNYSNPEFDSLYERFQAMDLDADRQPLLDRMFEIARHDAPVISGWYNQTFQLSHAWLGNVKLGKINRAGRKYLSLNAEARARARQDWNRPQRLPLLALTLAALLLGVAGVRHHRRHEAQRALPGGEP